MAQKIAAWQPETATRRAPAQRAVVMFRQSHKNRYLPFFKKFVCSPHADDITMNLVAESYQMVFGK
jgi:hypothetical protein